MVKQLNKRSEMLLPVGWTGKVVAELANQGIFKSANEVSKIYGGFKKNDPYKFQVLEAVLKVKENYQIEIAREAELRKSIMKG